MTRKKVSACECTRGLVAIFVCESGERDCSSPRCAPCFHKHVAEDHARGPSDREEDAFHDQVADRLEELRPGQVLRVWALGVGAPPRGRVLCMTFEADEAKAWHCPDDDRYARGYTLRTPGGERDDEDV